MSEIGRGCAGGDARCVPITGVRDERRLGVIAVLEADIDIDLIVGGAQHERTSHVECSPYGPVLRLEVNGTCAQRL